MLLSPPRDLLSRKRHVTISSNLTRTPRKYIRVDRRDAAAAMCYYDMSTEALNIALLILVELKSFPFYSTFDSAFLLLFSMDPFLHSLHDTSSQLIVVRSFLLFSQLFRDDYISQLRSYDLLRSFRRCLLLLPQQSYCWPLPFPLTWHLSSKIHLFLQR